MKKCPFCAEEIQTEALKCRYCNETLEGLKSVSTGKSSKSANARLGALIGFVLGFGGCEILAQSDPREIDWAATHAAQAARELPGGSFIHKEISPGEVFAQTWNIAVLGGLMFAFLGMIVGWVAFDGKSESPTAGASK